ncbi:MAG: phosphotransferase [Aquificaceae bacterium]
MRFESFKGLVEDLQLFSEGWRAFVYRAKWKAKEVAIKVARGKEKEYAIRKEGEILELLKGYKGFPQILMSGEDFIVYEFIKGDPIERLSLSENQKRLIYLKALDLIEILDRLGINKEELHRLDKNTLVEEGFEVYLLDFERGEKNAKKRHNLSQFLQILVREGYISRERAVELGRRYKEGHEVYHEVRKAIQGSL